MERVEKALEIQKALGIELNLSATYCIQGITYFDQGDQEKGLGLLEKAVELALKNNEKGFEGLFRIMLGRILGKTGPNQFERAEESILKGINILEELRLKPNFSQGYLYLGEFYTDIGQKEKAQENLKKAERMFQEMGMDYWLAKTDEVLKRL